MTSRTAAFLLLAVSLAACKSEVVCTSDQVTCDGQCISLASDPANCGACGRSCGAGESCSAGLCCQGAQCPPAVYAACFNGSAVQGATATPVAVGAPVAVETGPISLAWRGTSLWVANSISNTLDRMQVSPSGLSADGAFPTVSIPVSGPFSDLEFLAERDGLLYVSNAAVGSLVIVDPTAVSPIVAEIPLGDFAFPQGMAFAAGKAYVALNGSGEVVVVDLATRTVTRRIDLSALASPGASALPSRLAAQGDRVYVTLWNLDVTFSPAGHGRLAVIDTATDALVPSVNPVDLGGSCLNPAGIAALGEHALGDLRLLPLHRDQRGGHHRRGLRPGGRVGRRPGGGSRRPGPPRRPRRPLLLQRGGLCRRPFLGQRAPVRHRDACGDLAGARLPSLRNRFQLRGRRDLRKMRSPHRNLAAMAALAAAATLVAGALPARAADPLPRGEPVWLGPTAPARPARVVSLAPSLTDTVIALGLADRLVGVTRYDTSPEVKALPRVGGFLDPSPEAVLGLRPDLVLWLADGGAFPAVRRIAELGVPVLALPVVGVPDVLRAARRVGAALGDPAAGERLAGEMEAAVRAAEERASALPRRRVMLVIGRDPLVVAGPGSYPDALLRIAGGVNVVKGERPWPVYSLERAVADDPDLVVDAAVNEPADTIVRLGAIPAVKAGRVVRLPDDRVLRPGPQLPAALRQLQKALETAR